MNKKIGVFLYYFLRKYLFNYRQKRLLAEWMNGKSDTPPHTVKQDMLRKYTQLYDLRILVETGTYFGDMVEAMRPSYDRIYSVELSRELFKKARERFSAYDHIEIIHGDGGKILPQIMQRLDGAALFWLDGHYSAGLTAKGDSDTSIHQELEAIFDAAPLGHVVIIDDARCFGNDPGYPTIDEIKEYVFLRRPKSDILVENDSIIIAPSDSSHAFKFDSL